VALTNGFQIAFWVAAAFSVTGALVAAFGMPRVVRRPAEVRAGVSVESA